MNRQTIVTTACASAALWRRGANVNDTFAGVIELSGHSSRDERKSTGLLRAAMPSVCSSLESTSDAQLPASVDSNRIRDTPIDVASRAADSPQCRFTKTTFKMHTRLNTKQDRLYGFPGPFTDASEHIRFYIEFFFFSHFLVFGFVR